MTPAPISVDRLRELLDKATPGPWSQDHRRGKDGGYRTQVFDASGGEIATLAWHPKPARYEDGRKIISTDRAENAELIVAMHEALPALLHQLAERDAKLAELRQACWEARAVLGFDNDGDPTPDALVYPSLADLVRRDAAEFRKDYDEACNEAHAAERAREEATGLLLEWADDAEANGYAASEYPLVARTRAFLAASGGKAQ